MRTRRRIRRTAAALLAAMVVPLVGAPVSALAVPADTLYPRPVPESIAPKIGDTPSDFAHAVVPAPRSGDTKFDSPGASRAPQYEPPRTVTVVQPERTIVRDADQILPIALSGAALLVALGLAGAALIRVRSLRLG